MHELLLALSIVLLLLILYNRTSDVLLLVPLAVVSIAVIGSDSFSLNTIFGGC